MRYLVARIGRRTAVSIAACLLLGVFAAPAHAIGTPEALTGMRALDPLVTPEDPLAREGAWGTLRGASGPGFVSTTGWASHEEFPAVEGAYWVPSVFSDGGTGVAVGARLLASPGVVKRYFSLWFDMPNPATNKAGYELRFTEAGNNDYTVELKSWSNGSASTLAMVDDVVLPVGSYFALVDRGATLSAWVDAGVGYVNLLSVPDARFSSGSAGIATNGKGTRLRRFAAAVLPVVSP
jgi:hypothetical protein